MKNIKRQKTEPTKLSQYESLEDIEQAFDLFSKDFNKEFQKFTNAAAVVQKNQSKTNGSDDQRAVPRKISANIIDEKSSETNKVNQDPPQTQPVTQNSSARASSYILASAYPGAKTERKSSRMSQMESKIGINSLPASMRVRFQEIDRRDSRASCSSQDSVRLSNRLYSMDRIKEIAEKQNPQQVKVVPQGANLVKRKTSKTQLSYFSKAHSPQKENGFQTGRSSDDPQQKALEQVKAMACRINRKSSRLSNSSDIPGGWESLKDYNTKAQVSQGNLDKNNEKYMSGSNSSSSCNQEVMPVISSDLATFALAFNYILKGKQNQSNLNNLLSQKLLNTFGISRLQVEGIKGEEEKQQFIVKELTERIKEQYEQWQSKSEARNQDILRSEEEMHIKLQKRMKRTDKVKSQFEWMKVNTKYAALESTLKSTLIMKINDFYNQSFLQDKILQNQENQQFNNLSQDASQDIESYGEIQSVPVIVNARKNGEKALQSMKVTPIKRSQASLENFSNKRTTDTTPMNSKGGELGESFPQNLKQVYAEQLPEKREIKGNNILFNIPLRSTDQSSQRTIVVSKSQPDLSAVPSSSSFFGKVNSNEQAPNQAPLLNLMEEIQLRRMNTSESPLRRMRQKTVVINQANHQQIKDGYNSKLNQYIQMKQSKAQTTHISDHSSKSVAEMKDQIENCLLEGKQTSDQDLTYEYKWLKQGMIRGINQSESQNAQKKLLTNNFYWNQETEDMFLKKRTIKSATNFHQVKANNFNSLATYEFMRLLIKNQATQAIDRENLMSKFRRGEMLDEEQMNFLAATSELLNKFIDKQFIAEAMNILETTGIVDTVELVLAENILKSYSTIKSILDHHRDVFLMRKNEYALMRLKETEQNDKDAKLFLEKCKAFRKKTTMFRTVLHSMAEKKRKQQQSLQERSQLNSSRIQSAEGNLEEISQKKEIISSQKQKVAKISLLHPSSRLLMKDPRAKTPIKLEDKDTQQKNASKWFSQAKKNRTQIKSQKPTGHHQKKFLKFYSGGPSQGQNRDISESARLKAIIRIQSYFRMALARKRYQDQDFLNEQKLMQTQQQDTQGQVQEQQAVLINRPSNILPTERYDEDGIVNSIDIDSASYVGLLPHRKQSEALCFEERRRQSRLHSPQKSKHSPAETFKNAVILKINQLRQKKAENAEKNQNWRGRASELIQGAKENSLLKVKLEGLNLRQGDVNVQDARSNTALYYSVMNNNLLLAKFLLQRGANPNLQCEELNTPLHTAFKQGNILLILELLNNGANVYLKNCKGYTPLDFASEEILQHEHVNNAVQRSKSTHHEPFFDARSSFILSSSIVQN